MRKLTDMDMILKKFFLEKGMRYRYGIEMYDKSDRRMTFALICYPMSDSGDIVGLKARFMLVTNVIFVTTRDSTVVLLADCAHARHY